MEYNYYLPVNIVFGCGKADKIGELTAPYGKKALLVIGGGSVRATGLLDRVCAALEKAGVEAVIFDKVEQNPLTTTAERGAAFARENKCDVVVAVGGGSVMDCAKGIAFMAVNEGDVNDYIFARRSSDKALPIILLPTTCGSGSEGDSFAVMTNPATGDKKSLRCNAIIAKASIVDPECMMTMPKKVLAAVGFDALCHCMEAYTSNISQPITDGLSLQGIALVAQSLPGIYTGADASTAAWEKLTIASTIGGMVINNAGITLAHGMEHPASGLKNIIHGEGLAALTPPVIAATYNGRPAGEEKFAEISRILGGQNAADCADAISRLLETLELNIKLGDLGITADDIPWMTENCLKVATVNIANTPADVTPEMIARIYEEAM